MLLLLNHHITHQNMMISIIHDGYCSHNKPTSRTGELAPPSRDGPLAGSMLIHWRATLIHGEWLI